MFKELNNGIEIFINNRFLSYGSKQSKCFFGLITQETLDSQNVNAIFEFFVQFMSKKKKMHIFFKKGADHIEIEHKNILISGGGGGEGPVRP